LRREWLPDPERRDEQPSSSRRRGGTDGKPPRARPAAWTGPREQPGAARHGRDFHRFRARRVHGGGGGGGRAAYTERGGVPGRRQLRRSASAPPHCALDTSGVAFYMCGTPIAGCLSGCVAVWSW